MKSFIFLICTLLKFATCYYINNLSCFEVEDYYCAVHNITLTKENPHFTIISNVSNQITYVGFRGSTIPVLTGDFCTDIHNLTALVAYESSIESIDADSFINCTNLKELDIWGNKFKQLPANAFYHLKNLEKMNLMSSFIEYIHPEAFVGLENLQELQLLHNKLSLIDSRAFRPLKNLQSLELGGNGLLDLDVDSILEYSPLKTIFIYDSKFECRRQDEILRVLNAKGVTIGRPIITLGPTLVCVSASHHQELLVSAITHQYAHYEAIDESNLLLKFGKLILSLIMTNLDQTGQVEFE